MQKHTAQLICLLYLSTAGIRPVFAIPPPEALLLISGSVLYPGLLLLGVLLVMFKWVWIKTRLYLFWRLNSGKISGLLLITVFLLSYPMYSFFSKARYISPISEQTLKNWQPANPPFTLIDLRQTHNFQKAHLLNALNFPNGRGLDRYLQQHPEKNLFIYCEKGLRSSNLIGLETDSEILWKSLENHKIFYFPGGFQKIMALGDQSAIPVVINIPSHLAAHLLKNPRYTKIEVTQQGGTVFSGRSEHAFHPIKPEAIPVFEGSLTHEKMAGLISAWHLDRGYTLMPDKPVPDKTGKILWLAGILFSVLFILRRKELSRNLSGGKTSVFLWIKAGLSVITALIILFYDLMNLPVPFDTYLNYIDPALPMDKRYFIAIYSVFVLIVLGLLMFPAGHRLNFLHAKFTSRFSGEKYIRFRPRRRLGAASALALIVGLLFYWGTVSLSTLLIASAYLMLPFLVDALLLAWIMSLKTVRPSLRLLRFLGFRCEQSGEAVFHVKTRSKSTGRFQVRFENASFSIGLFSATPYPKNKTSHLSEEWSFELWCRITRQLLLIFRQDIEFSLTENAALVSLKLCGNALDPVVLNRHTLLYHYHLCPDFIHPRFNAHIFRDVFLNTSPLLLETLQLRWDKQGGYLKALHKLNIRIKSGDRLKAQISAFSHKIYMDESLEKSSFSAGKIHLFIRNKTLAAALPLAIECLEEDYATRMYPGIQLRLAHLEKHLSGSPGPHQLKRIIRRAIKHLSTESALWQCYTGVLHQYAYSELKRACQQKNTAEWLHHPDKVSQPGHYELNFMNGDMPRAQSAAQTAFYKTESIRSRLRELQLQEWRLIGLLLEKWRCELKMPVSLTYLHSEDIHCLPGSFDRLSALLTYRKNVWDNRNSIHFPECFSILESETSFPKKSKHISSQDAVRTAGNQEKIFGSCVLYEPGMDCEKLPSGSILLADNLLPEALIRCQHLKGIILQKGSYLSHTSILAREKNIPMIVQYPFKNITDGDRIFIHSGNKIIVLKHRILDWFFLDASARHSDTGNKALRLAVLKEEGFHIPESIVITSASVQTIFHLMNEGEKKEAWKLCYQEIRELFSLFTLHHSTLILRSSANLEDSPDHSYAGLLYSEAHITTVSGLLKAINTACRQLKDREALIQKYSGENSLALNLILQNYIQGGIGGVLFTRTDTPGFMQVEMALKGAEAVVAGNDVLASLQFNQEGIQRQARGRQEALTEIQYRTLYKLGCAIEKIFGRPQDIEWVLSKGTFYIIQSRDILGTHPA